MRTWRSFCRPAPVADYLRSEAAARLGALETLQAASPEQLDSFTAEERASYFEALNQLRGECEEHLRQLPLVERQDWERRLGRES